MTWMSVLPMEGSWNAGKAYGCRRSARPTAAAPGFPRCSALTWNARLRTSSGTSLIVPWNQPRENGAGGLDSRRTQTEVAVNRMLERPVVVSHRGDGKPEVAADGVSVSASHAAGVTLAVVGSDRVSCDAEAVRDRTPEDWQALLGAEQFALAELIQRERGEELSVTATRIWGAVECLRKIGRAVVGPITLGQSRPDGWVRFDSGQAQIATFLTRLRDEPHPVVFTILTEGTQ